MARLSLLLLMLVPCVLFAQDNAADSVYVRKFEVTTASYKDFVLHENKIYAITNHDSLIVWDMDAHKIIDITNGVAAVAKSALGQLSIATTDGEIKALVNGKDWEKKSNFVGAVYYLLANKNDIPVVITSDGFYYGSQRFPIPEDSPLYFNRSYMSSAFARMPDAVFLDSTQRVWMAFNNGEFGGEGYFFDLVAKTFYPDESFSSLYHEKYPEKHPGFNFPPVSEYIKEFPNDIMVTDEGVLYRFPKDVTLLGNTPGITEDEKGNFYTACSLMHFFLDGCIYKTTKSSIPGFYKGVEIQILDKESEYDPETGRKNNFRMINEYLGPVLYNKFDKQIYFYTDKGFFRLIEKGKEYSKELIFRPYITWTGWQTNAIGAQMNVIKFEFIDKDKFVFLTSNNGIGYYTGDEVIYYK